jgi:hypothetical protein
LLVVVSQYVSQVALHHRGRSGVQLLPHGDVAQAIVARGDQMIEATWRVDSAG